MTIISFTVLGVPVAKGRARLHRINTKDGRHFDVMHTPRKTAEAEETFVARSLEFRPFEPLAGPLKLNITFVLPVPKSSPKWLKDRVEDDAREQPSSPHLGPPHIKRPDLDNLEKLVKDACNGVFWNDDSQVYHVIKRKVYGSVPRTIVRIEEVDC